VIQRSREPGYVALARSGELKQRAETAVARMGHCELCPRRCGVDRLNGELGFCRTGRNARVASYSPHFGEESPLVGTHGSGTLFMSSCNLLCSFCQNREISHGNEGLDADPDQIARVMLLLAEQGCHNVNAVTPSHVVPQTLEALAIAADRGLSVPLVYNSGGYDEVETLRLLDGVVDIYMPDFKFWDGSWSDRLCGAPDYPEKARAALREMHRQVGDLELDENGLARSGLLVRHLVMPGGIAGTRRIAEFIAEEISPDTYVNVMDQYRPCGDARRDETIDRRLTAREFREAAAAAREAGLHRLDPRDRVRLALF
jgi:putative pyruvate formate lyase activating enzyme